MREANIKARQRKKFKVTTNSNHKHPVFDNLLERQFDVEQTDRVYASDVTYIWTQEGWLYLAVLAESCNSQPLVLHADNGALMKSQTLQAKLYELGITPSHSRPRVSNDNPYSEALFRKVKYCLQRPSEGFASLAEAREWVNRFVYGYNHVHRHSGIRFVTPQQRHSDRDKESLAQRSDVYEQAKAARPERWSGSTRNWTPIGAVALNPERTERQSRYAA